MQIILVFSILIVTIILFVSDRLRLDLVALLALLALYLTGLISVSEALAGFADPLVIMIAGLFVVSGGLLKTGVADMLGHWLGQMAGQVEARLIVLVMLVTAAFSAVMSSTGTVAVMMPVVMNLAWQARISPSKLMMPLAFASLLGGMVTLIGTPPNLVVSNQLQAQGLAPFKFLDFTPIGLALLGVGIVYMLVLGRRLLPARASDSRPTLANTSIHPDKLIHSYALSEYLYRLRVAASSGLIGKTLEESHLRQHYQISVLAITAKGSSLSRAMTPSARFEEGDILLLEGKKDQIIRCLEEQGLEFVTHQPAESEALLPSNLGLAEVIVPPRSSLIGKTLQDLQFRKRYRVTVISIKRGGDTLLDLGSPLRFGDTLLLKGPWAHIHLLYEQKQDFVVLAETPDTEASQRLRAKAPWAIVIMLAMLALMTFNIVPAVIAVLLAAVAMVLSKCITVEESYKSINWESIILIAAILPMATALENTGAIELVVQHLLQQIGSFSPWLITASLFMITSVLSQVMSNTATAVLLAPVAFQMATSLGLSPYPLLMTLALAASTSFSTPMASPVNTLVLGPGAYRFQDFVKVGIPLQVVMFLATILLVPVLFPF